MERGGFTAPSRVHKRKNSFNNVFTVRRCVQIAPCAHHHSSSSQDVGVRVGGEGGKRGSGWAEVG